MTRRGFCYLSVLLLPVSVGLFRILRDGERTPSVSPRRPTRPAEEPKQLTLVPIRYVNVAGGAGLHFTHSNGGAGHRYYLETTGAGCAFLDYNNDGWLDVFAVQSGPLPHIGHGAPPRNALFRNNRDGTFTDVTAAAGLAEPCGYGQGVAVADYDNDGFKDILVTSYGEVHLFHNRGDGTFSDVTLQAGLGPHADHTVWSTSAAWGDYDNDGYLDLFICRYVKWTPETDKDCPRPDGRARGTCPPQVYDPDTCVLYHNNGDGTFTDVTQVSGIGKVRCKALGAVWLDFDGDGRQDILISNDGMPNVLLRNEGHGHFVNVAVDAGVAYGESGTAYNGMGIALADVRHSGHEDVAIANFAGQPKSLYSNVGGGLFSDSTISSHLGSSSLQRLGFGCAFLDYDLDGWPDLAVANGHVSDLASLYTPGLEYAEPAQLFHNNGNGTFTEDFRSTGDLALPQVSRGLAVGDYNNDGAPDILINHLNGPLGLYENRGAANHWVTLRFEGTKSNRDGVGTKVWIHCRDARQYAEVRGDSSYCSHNDERLSFGLGAAAQADKLIVRWPSGHMQEYGPLVANRFYLVREGDPITLDPRLAQRKGAESTGSSIHGGPL